MSQASSRWGWYRRGTWGEATMGDVASPQFYLRAVLVFVSEAPFLITETTLTTLKRCSTGS